MTGQRLPKFPSAARLAIRPCSRFMSTEKHLARTHYGCRSVFFGVRHALKNAAGKTNQRRVMLPNPIPGPCTPPTVAATADPPVTANGPAHITFASALQFQQSRNPDLIAKSQIPVASSSSAGGQKATQATQSYNDYGLTSVLPMIVAEPAEVAVCAIASNVENGFKSSADKAAGPKANQSQQPSINLPSASRFRRSPDIKSATSACSSGPHPDATESLVAHLASSSVPTSSMIPGLSAETAVAQFARVTMATTPEAASPSSNSSPSQSLTNITAVATLFDPGTTVQSLPVVAAESQVSSDTADGLGLSPPGAKNSNQGSVTQSAVLPFDVAGAPTFQGMFASAEVSMTKGVSSIQPPSSGSAPSNERRNIVASPFSVAVSPRTNIPAPAEPFEGPSVISSTEHAQTTPVLHPQTVTTGNNAAISPRATDGQKNKAVISAPTEQPDGDSAQSSTSDIVGAVTLQGAPLVPTSPALAGTSVAANRALVLGPEDSPRLAPPWGQDRLGPASANAHTDATATNNLQGQASLPPGTPKTDSVNAEAVSDLAAPNLAADVQNPQQLTVGQSEATHDTARQTPHVTDEPLRTETRAAPVLAARMVDSLGQTEMHVGLRTQAFGTVDVRTGLRDTQLGLSISSEKGDLRSFLAPEMSGLQTTLRQHEVRFESIRFIEHGAANSAFSGDTNSHSHYFKQTQSSSSGHSLSQGLPQEDTNPEFSGPQISSPEMPTRLDVHA